MFFFSSKIIVLSQEINLWQWILQLWKRTVLHWHQLKKSIDKIQKKRSITKEMRVLMKIFCRKKNDDAAFNVQLRWQKKMGEKILTKRKSKDFKRITAYVCWCFFLREKERINAIGSSMGIAKGKRWKVIQSLNSSRKPKINAFAGILLRCVQWHCWRRRWWDMDFFLFYI